MTALLILAIGAAAGALVMHRIDGHRSEASFWNEARGKAGFDAADELYERLVATEAQAGQVARSRDFWQRKARKAVGT